MTSHLRRAFNAFMIFARFRPPEGHLRMLREEVGRREDKRLADEDAIEKRHDVKQTRAIDARL